MFLTALVPQVPPDGQLTKMPHSGTHFSYFFVTLKERAAYCGSMWVNSVKATNFGEDEWKLLNRSPADRTTLAGVPSGEARHMGNQAASVTWLTTYVMATILNIEQVRPKAKPLSKVKQIVNGCGFVEWRVPR